MMALPEYPDGGEHADDEQGADQDEQAEMPPREAGISSWNDERDHEGEAHEERSRNPEDEVIPTHGARIR
jgi:hypothetical protein